MRELEELLRERVLLLDGAMGTMLMEFGIKVNQAPELLNVERPEVIEQIHRAYVEAGAQIIETNTFGSNRIKLSHYNLENRVRELTARGVELAKRASGGRALVALSVGPTGVFAEPIGELSFDELVEVFAEQIEAGANAGADLIIIETMADIKEAKSAVIGAKKVCDLPVIVSMTYEEDGRTLLGTPPEVSAIVFESLGVSGIGANCSLGPEGFKEVVVRLSKITDLPIVIYANAGIPKVVHGKTIYPETPESFARKMAELVKLGANVVGGCCGTTPKHIKMLKELIPEKPVERQKEIKGLKVASRTSWVVIGDSFPTRIVGERINPTGKKKLQNSLKERNFSLVRSEAIKQVEKGAEILDVNVGVPGINEKEVLKEAVRTVMEAVNVPLMIDTKDPEALEEGLKMCDGKPIVNSCSAEKRDIERILPLVKKYGAGVILLAVDEKGISKDGRKRAEVIRKLMDRMTSEGIRKEDMIADVLNLAVSAMPGCAEETLKALRIVKNELNLPTILGVSNVSFGLPSRSSINSAFVSMAIHSGLDAGIVNPLDENIVRAIFSADVLVGKDPEAKRLSSIESPQEERKEEKKTPKNLLDEIFQKVVEGDKEGIVEPVKKALEKYEPLEISDRALIPALEKVGEEFEKGKIFLPQMLKSAQAVQTAFSYLKEALKKEGVSGKKLGKIVMATVYGDVHEIGKNIVITLLENSGFEVVDLGVNVPPEKVVEAVKKEKADVVGLSALMTTTLPSMEETVKALRDANLNVPVVVGGAVVDEEFAKRIGAIYGEDARQAVKIMRRLVGDKTNGES